MFGTDELARQAFAVRDADRCFRRNQWDVEESGELDRSDLPPTVRRAADEMEAQILKFVTMARQSTR